MKVLFFTLGDIRVASSRVRVFGYLRLLNQAGIICKVVIYTPPLQAQAIIHTKKINILRKVFFKLYSAIAIIKVLFLSKFYDVIFIQKITLSKFSLILLRTINKNIIFDLDDAIYLFKDISYILRSVKAIVVGNTELYNYTSRFNDNTYEIPSPVFINSAYTTKKFRKETIILGWMGSPETSKYLHRLKEVLLQLKIKYPNLHIQLIGAANDLKEMGFEILEWNPDLETSQISNFDIGIMPLPDNEFTRAKCGYKLLQYMAMGIPAVASPVGINFELIKNGINGFLASLPEEWKEKLSILIEDEKLRNRMGAEGRKKVKTIYSYQANISRLIDILKSVQNHQSLSKYNLDE